MSWHEAVVNIIHREVRRVMDRNTRRTPVIVDSYDKTTYAAKFKLMPDSVDQPVITGWIPLHTMQTGNNYGWHAPPNIGDHGWLDFHEDDREGGFFAAATFNDQLKPMPTEAGELQYQTIWGHVLYFKNDGSLTIKNGTKSGTGGTGAKPPTGSSTQSSIVIDASGTVTITAPTVKVAGNLNVTGAVIAGFGGGDQVGVQTHTHADAGGIGPSGAPNAGT